jgi:hypothetical protein
MESLRARQRERQMDIGNPASPDDGVEVALRVVKQRRVAVIAVHGVADQKLGETGQALAELLIAQAPNGHAYEPGVRRDEILHVDLLQPLRSAQTSADGTLKKFRQSTGSDFLREGGTATGQKRALASSRTPLSKGADFSDYTLAKASLHGAPIDTYTAPRIAMTRAKGATADSVDIHEMYWADLSRLSGTVPRILTELFTLLFRLSALGRDTVQYQRAATAFEKDPAWGLLARLQTFLDFAYSRVLALLFLQLVMVALILVPFGLLASFPRPLHLALSAVAGTGALLWILYRFRRAIPALAAGAVVGAALWKAPAVWVDGLLWLAFLSVLYDWWLRVCEERFPLVRLVGWVLWSISAGVVIIFAFADASSDLTMWVWGALRALEVVLTLILGWWVIAAPVVLIWFCASVVATRRRGAGAATGAPVNVHAKSSVATARVGLFVSLGFFVIVTMTAWALVETGVKHSVERVPYVPFLFSQNLVPVPGDATSPALTTAEVFLDDRFVNSTSGFSVIALLLFPLVLYLVLMLLPSVLAELGVIAQQFGLLGQWLTGGYRKLDRVVAALVAVGVVTALLVAAVFVAPRLDIDLSSTLLGRMAKLLSDLSQNWLKYFVISAGTATLALTAAGGVLSRYVPWLRAPLDAALDVDNHFREFPRNAIPRARIFSRYVAVLKHVAAQDYDRIVIVSHSQGTVISADLLRYMQERAADVVGRGKSDVISVLWGKISGKVMLVTAGCPLRQLYAARFPEMYDWVLGDSAGTMGPRAADVGALLWVNVYTTGDYVGRWLWSRTANASEYPVSQIDDIQQRDVYSPSPMPAGDWRTLMGGATERDISVGAGAHTHYFALDQETMAAVVDALIAQ